MEKIRKVEPVDFEFDMMFVLLMKQKPLEAAEKLLDAFRDARREDERLLENIELNIPDVNDIPTALLCTAIRGLKHYVSESLRDINETKFGNRMRSMAAKRLRDDTVQAMKDLFGVLDAEQITKLQKAIDEVRGSLSK